MSKILLALQRMGSRRDLEVAGKRALVTCPNPSHSGGRETKPSFSIYLEGPRAGEGRCWSCGHRLTWRQVVQELELPREARFLAEEYVASAVNPEEEGEMFAPRRERTTSSMMWPEESEWRGVPGSLLRRVGARLVPSKKGVARMRLPVSIRGQEVGHIDCALEKVDGELGYVNSSGHWAMHALYPYDYVRGRRPRVLVLEEGPRDALITIRNGMMALSTLGSENWSKRCASLLLRTDAECVVIMTDPDDAGERLMKNAYRDLGGRVDVRCVVLPSKVVDGKRIKMLDPADLNERKLEMAMERVGVRKVRGTWQAD